MRWGWCVFNSVIASCPDTHQPPPCGLQKCHREVLHALGLFPLSLPCNVRAPSFTFGGLLLVPRGYPYLWSIQCLFKKQEEVLLPILWVTAIVVAVR